MRSALLLTVCLTVALNGPLRADEQAQLKTLEKLLIEVRQVLPAGWEAELSPSAEDRPLEDVPVLVIRSKAPLRVEHFYPGMSNEVETQIRDRSRLETVELRIVCQPFVSPRRYQELSLLNQQRERVRAEFVNTQLRGLAWAYKGGAPMPPSAFEPKNDAERRLVREYQLLWLNTQPLELPTHYYRSLAFRLEQDHSLAIQEESAAATYQQLQASVQKIILPYVTENSRPKDTLEVPEDTGDATLPK